MLRKGPEDVTIDLRAMSAGENSEQTDAPKKSASCLRSRKFGLLLESIPLGTAIDDSIQTLLGMVNQPNWLIYTASTGAFVTGSVIYDKYARRNFYILLDIIKKPGSLLDRLPNDWLKLELSKQKEYAALGLAAAITAYVTFSDSTLSYFVSQKIPGEYGFSDNVSPTTWSIARITILILTGSGVILIKGVETWKALREMLSNHKIEYANTLSRWISPLMGGIFGIFGAIADMISSLVGIKAFFEINTLPKISFIAAASILNGVADYSLTGRYIRDSINQLIGYLAKNRPDKKDLFFFAIAIASSGLLAYAWQCFTAFLFPEMIRIFNIDAPNVTHVLSTILSWGVSGTYLIVCTSCILDALESISRSLSELGSYVSNRLCTPPVSEEPELMLEVESDSPPAIAVKPYLKNSNTLFHHSSTINDKQNIPERRSSKFSCPKFCTIV